jgi:hypothetical protein
VEADAGKPELLESGEAKSSDTEATGDRGARIVCGKLVPAGES